MALQRTLSAAMTRTLSAFELMPSNTPNVKLFSGDPTNLVKKIASPQMFVQMGCPESSDALIIVEFQLVTAIVEHAVRKKISARPVDKRPLTAVDYALLGPFIDNFLGKIDTNTDDAEAIAQMTNEGRIASIQEVNAFFEPKNYMMALIDFKFAQTDRSAKFGLIYSGQALQNPDAPLSASTSKPTKQKVPKEDIEAPNAETATSNLWRQVKVDLEVTTRAFPARYEELQQLSKGGALALPLDIFDGAKLECHEAGFHFDVDIGQSNDKRAVEIRSSLQRGTFPTASASSEATKPTSNGPGLASPDEVLVPSLGEIDLDSDEFLKGNSQEDAPDHRRHENETR